MTKWNGSVVLKKEPYKIIKWFTENFDKEIGALGIGEVKDGIITVEKLVFPKQEVTSSHVHFSGDNWGDIIKELSVEELSKILFYWHKHPSGCSKSSQGDEDDTYDVFMDEASGREIMAFLVTSQCGNEMKQDCRIEMRAPIWGSIEAKMSCEDDNQIEEECLKIIEDKIIKPEPVTYDWPVGKKAKYGFKEVSKNTFIPERNIDDKVSGVEEYIDITFGNGMATVKCLEEIEKIVDQIFIEADDILSSKLKRPNGRTITYNLVPNKGMYKELKSYLKGVYDNIAEEIRLRIEQEEEEESDELDKTDLVMQGYDNLYDKETLDDSKNYIG